MEKEQNKIYKAYLKKFMLLTSGSNIKLLFESESLFELPIEDSFK